MGRWRHLAGEEAGWVTCGQGHAHWGRHGAAGLLLIAPAHGRLLLQRRALWSHHGGTWGVPGGARFRTETGEQAARRETLEEVTIDLDGTAVSARHLDDHGGWSYETLVAAVPAPLDAAPRGGETAEVRWVGVADLARLRLHPGFATTLPLVLRLAGLAVDG